MASLSGKWALITGASRGVGYQVAKGLAGLRCNLVLHCRAASHADRLIQDLKSSGVKVAVTAGELSDQTQVDAMLDEALKDAGAIDIVYNNAAIMTAWRDNPWDVPAEDFRKSFEVNVIALAHICYRLVPPMRARGWGRVINVTSGIQNEPQLTAYAVSKAAVDKFVRDFVPDLKGSGVAMNLLDPGWLRTDLGGPKAPNDPASVVPGALIPALMDDGVSGRLYCAQDYAGMSLDAALEKARRG